jgi:uncharacterized protein
MRRSYCVFNKSTESFLGLNVGRADTQFARLRGLLGRLELRSDEGLWMIPSRGIHTIGVLFPIDLVYLNSAFRVIHLVEHLSPFRLGPLRLKSSSVLELPPHTIYASHTHVGDQLLICPPQEMERYLSNIGVPNQFRRGCEVRTTYEELFRPGKTVTAEGSISK